MSKNTLKDKNIIYNKVFDNELGKVVLTDLRLFCNATKSSFLKDGNQAIDPYELARQEGRREVFLQIMNTMKVDFSDWYAFEEDYE